MTFKPLHRDILVITPEDWEEPENYVNDKFYKYNRPLKYEVFSKLISPLIEPHKYVYVNQLFAPEDYEEEDDDYDEELCTYIEISDISAMGIIATNGEFYHFQSMHSLVFPDFNAVYFDWQDLRWNLNNVE